MEFDGKYFSELNFAYSAFIKAGITLLSSKKIKVRSVPGHHLKIIEMMARILDDDSFAVLGNAMRLKRNRDFYEGGIEVTEKECKGYIEFVEKSVAAVGKNI